MPQDWLHLMSMWLQKWTHLISAVAEGEGHVIMLHCAHAHVQLQKPKHDVWVQQLASYSLH